MAYELNTVKDINSKYSKYNLVVSAFSAKDNYVRNLLRKRADGVEYIKKNLSQVNHQLYEWLATVNERSTNNIPQSGENVNTNSNSKIQYKLKGEDEGKKKSIKIYYEMSKGEIKKLHANHTRMKVYSKTDAEKIVNHIISTHMSFGDKYGTLSGKDKAAVIDMLWQKLNSTDAGNGDRIKVGQDIAEFIINSAVVEDIVSDETNSVDVDVVEALRPYLHTMDLSGIKGDIKSYYDTDKSVYARWGKRKGTRGVAPDVVAMELEAAGFYIDATHPAEVLFQIDEQYRKAINNLKRKQNLQADMTYDRNEVAIYHMAEDGTLTRLSAEGYGRYVRVNTDKTGTFIVCIPGVQFVMPMWGYAVILVACVLVLAAAVTVTVILVRRRKKRERANKYTIM